MDSPWIKSMSRELDARGNQGLYRQIPKNQSSAGLTVEFEGRRLHNLCSNNYLNLASHSDVTAGGMAAAKKWGAGTGAARLLGGDTPLHRQLEERLADIHDCEAALLFNTGYMANIGLITSLSQMADCLILDKLVHASLIDGMLLSNKKFMRYRHGDMDHLESLLKKSDPKKCLVVTEVLFSMDGDFAPLEELFALQKKYGFFLVLDEAHSFGGYPEILQKYGERLTSEMAVMGTLGKALGSSGAFICGSQTFVNFLINCARPFIYSTALSPFAVGSAFAALDVIAKEPQRCERLAGINARVHNFLKNHGSDLASREISQGGPSHIVPLLVGTPERALDLQKYLLDLGFYTLAVRPPTVPQGTSRLRISLSCDLADNVVGDFLGALKNFNWDSR